MNCIFREADAADGLSLSNKRLYYTFSSFLYYRLVVADQSANLIAADILAQPGCGCNNYSERCVHGPLNRELFGGL